MTAATVETDTQLDADRARLEAEVARRRAADEARAARPGRRDMRATDGEPIQFETPDSFKRRIADLMAETPYNPAEDEPIPSDDLGERRRAVKREAWANSLRMARLDDRAHWTLADLAADQHGPMLQGFVDGLGPDAAFVNLVLGGRVGSGKTSAAIAAGNAAVERGLMARVVKHKHYLDWLRPDGTPPGLTTVQVRERFRTCDLLILDDLGAELDGDREATRFVREETLALVGDRIESGKATIVTTNEKPEVRNDQGDLVGGLMLTLGERLLSRLSERGHALRFVGQDRRGRLSW